MAKMWPREDKGTSQDHTQQVSMDPDLNRVPVNPSRQHRSLHPGSFLQPQEMALFLFTAVMSYRRECFREAASTENLEWHSSRTQKKTCLLKKKEKGRGGGNEIKELYSQTAAPKVKASCRELSEINTRSRWSRERRMRSTLDAVLSSQGITLPQMDKQTFTLKKRPVPSSHNKACAGSSESRNLSSGKMKLQCHGYF